MGIINWIGKKYELLRYKFFPTKTEQEVKRWNNDNGETKLKFKYNLNSNSIVFDLGGYQGQFASDLFARMPCVINIFEPVPEFASFIKNRFKNNEMIITHSFGFSNKDEEKSINILANKTSSYINKKAPSSNSVNIKLKDIVDYIKNNSFDNIDLLKINIEGAEYDVINHLINFKKISTINYLLIQFHELDKNSIAKMNLIRAELKKTHICDFCYQFVWELWVRKI